MSCPVCHRTYCDHTPDERGQTYEEMLRDLDAEATAPPPALSVPSAIPPKFSEETATAVANYFADEERRKFRPGQHEIEVLRVYQFKNARARSAKIFVGIEGDIVHSTDASCEGQAIDWVFGFNVFNAETLRSLYTALPHEGRRVLEVAEKRARNYRTDEDNLEAVLSVRVLADIKEVPLRRPCTTRVHRVRFSSVG